jgi:hypothetical protein
MSRPAIPTNAAELARNTDAEVTEVTAATTLTPDQQIVEVTLPANGSDFDVTLPPVASCPGAEFLIYAIGAGAGEVGVQDQDDGFTSFDESDKLSAAKDYFFIKNMGGRQYVMLSEVST